MNDGNLLIFGCVVSFIALAGAYVYVRERFLAGPAVAKARPARVVRRDEGRAA